MLTPEELQKYKNCLFMESVRPIKIEQTDDLADQITFLRSHGKGNMRFYPISWFEGNPARTRSMYFENYSEYSKKFNFNIKKYDNASAKRQELEAKMLGLNVTQDATVYVNK